jgi:hypothetical protein
LSDGNFRQRYRCTFTGTRATSCRSGFYKRRSDVPEDQRVVILSGLVANKPQIRAVHRGELVLSNIGDPGCQAEEESINGNDVNCIDPAKAIHISSRQPAS